MPSPKQALLLTVATFSIAAGAPPRAHFPSIPRWVLGGKGKSCTETCKSAGKGGLDELGKPYKCIKDQYTPTNNKSYKVILENVMGDKMLAQCHSMVDESLKPSMGPSIERGVCWYDKDLVLIDCDLKPEGDALLICPCGSDKTYDRNPVPEPILYPAAYKDSDRATLNFSITFPWLVADSFECLGSFQGVRPSKTSAGDPETWWKIAEAIKVGLGTQLADVEFVAPFRYHDILEAKVRIYANPEELVGESKFIATSRIEKIGAWVVNKVPEMELCGYPQVNDKYLTPWGERPVFPVSVKPTHTWTPARRYEFLGDANSEEHSGVGGVASLSLASAGVLLVAGAIVTWRRQLTHELVPDGC